ncbi:MAG: DNA polymerase III subunit delta [Caldilineaceae bacterium SB0666_bin_21]|nr:DNA polymerase III subunit delta [Caldilineaceae bacterium SB0666_bin_21]
MRHQPGGTGTAVSTGNAIPGADRTRILHGPVYRQPAVDDSPERGSQGAGSPIADCDHPGGPAGSRGDRGVCPAGLRQAGRAGLGRGPDVIHLCAGADPFRYQLFLKNLKAGLDPAMADFNYVELEAPSASLEDIEREIQALPVMADERIVAAHKVWTAFADSVRRSKTRGRETLAERWQLSLTALAGMPATTVLVLYEPDLKPDFKAIRELPAPAGGMAVPTIEDLEREKKLRRENLAAPKRNEMRSWAEFRCSEKQIRIAGPAVDELVRRASSDLRNLDQELDKLAAYAKGEPISLEAVRELVPDYSEDFIFALSNAVFQQQRDEAMRVLSHLLSQGLHPIQILATLGSQARMLAAVRLSGESPDAIAKAMKVKPYAVQRSMRNAARLSPDQVRAMVDMLLEADLKMKSTPHAEAVLETLVGHLVSPDTWLQA